MYSMTGFGRGSRTLDGREMTIELKSVNHRFLDLAFRMPRFLNFLEEELRNGLQQSVTRGHIEVYVKYQNTREDAHEVIVDMTLARAYMQAVTDMQQSLQLPQDLTLMQIAKLPDVLTVSERQEDTDAVKQLCRDTAADAIEELLQLKLIEGDKLKLDLARRIQDIEDKVSQVAQYAPLVVSEYRTKLQGRLQELLDKQPVSEDRIAIEVAMFADKCSIEEEIVRLNSHNQLFLDTLDEGQSIGRKLDFIVQEMNREINTIGSKASDTRILNLVVDMKGEIEKIREQVQNIE